jgi:hypothetical protein
MPEAAKPPHRHAHAVEQDNALLTPKLKGLFNAYIAGDMDFHALHAASGLSIEKLKDAFNEFAPSVPFEGAARFRWEYVIEIGIAEYAAGKIDLKTAMLVCDMDEAELRNALDVRGLPQAEARREMALSAVSRDPMIPIIVAAMRRRFPECLRIWLSGDRAWGIHEHDENDAYELFVVIPDAADGQIVHTHDGCLADSGMSRALGGFTLLDLHVLNASYFTMLADDGGYCRRVVREGIIIHENGGS